MNTALKIIMLFMIFFITAHADEDLEFIFSHGIAADGEQVRNYTYEPDNPDKLWIMPENSRTFNYRGAAPNSFFRLNRHEVSLAQQPDICEFAEHFQPLERKPAVLVGLSCGASTILSFMAQRYSTNVRALVLESPFDDPMSIVNNMMHRFCLSYLPYSQELGAAALSFIFTQYRHNGITPLERVTSHPHFKAPTFMVASLQDTLVPAASTARLYQELRRTNPNAYLLLLPKGRHSTLLADECGQEYCDTVHAFYERYNLPHDPERARRGHISLQRCQPSDRELAELQN